MTPLAVYIHWPFCKSKCPYCDFNSHVRESVEQDRWKAALLRELDTMAERIPDRQVSSIFFGGGTPSLMPPATAAALIERVHQLWPVSENIEITLEANPTSVEADAFRDFRTAGVNRVSLGVQSLIDSELQFLGRGHSAKEALKAVALAADIFPRFTFDLIYARPNQTPRAWEAELQEALQYARGHMSLYQLTIEENTAFHHAYAKGGFTLPDEAQAEALYRLTEEMMDAHGLAAYEVSNYAAPAQESRHNLAYWHGDDYVGIGPGAHGRLTLQGNVSQMADGGWRITKKESSSSSVICHPSSGAVRHATQTIKSPERWLEQVERVGHGLELWEETDRTREAQERLMMGLRLHGGINYKGFEKRAGYALESYLNIVKRDFYITQGLLENDPLALRATLSGRLVLNRLTAELLA